jgi:hypothetical protein
MENQATITANKKFVQQFIDRVFNEHNAGATRDYFSPDVKWHGGTLGTIEGSDAMTDFTAPCSRHCRTCTPRR